uniref:Arrestin C-terminal-like domain-containing protein n=1 Tax=Pectinophora gossypiella TaxID=13191 RepID=A0A1E1WTJ3_PECGO
MGIHCEINLCKHLDGAFTPGSTVSGCIKYAIDEDTVFNRITVSLKGNGRLSMKRKQSKNRTQTYWNKEEYVDIDNVIHNDENGEKKLPVGSYESQFSFTLPEKIPSTLYYSKYVASYDITCKNTYYIRIKFKRPGFLSFDKKFKKEITVVSGITPRYPNIPSICGERKSLTQLFSKKNSVVDIKATIKTRIIKPGDKIELTYEVNNDTNIVIKDIETKLMEVYTFTSENGRDVTADKDVKDTDSKTGSIKAGDTKSMDIEIIPPSDKVSLDYSKMVTREYVVSIIARLPLPHRNAVLKIPVQIGEEDVIRLHGDAPPSYWETMVEDTKKDGKDDVDFKNMGEKS